MPRSGGSRCRSTGATRSSSSLFTEPGRPGDRRRRRRADDPGGRQPDPRQPLSHHGRIARRGGGRHRRGGLRRVRQPGDRPRRRDRPLHVHRGYGAVAAPARPGLPGAPRGRGRARRQSASCMSGPAGAGKSTLAMACARRGFGVFAEDAVFVRARPTTLELWGMPWVQRLLPDAGRFFPELSEVRPRRQPNGETKLEVDLDRVHPGGRSRARRRGRSSCSPADTGGPTRIEPVEDAAAATMRSRSTGRGTAAGRTGTTTPRGAWRA